MDKKMGKGQAIGKIILMGEHAVVYGERAIAIPFPAAKIKTSIIETDTKVSLDSILYKGDIDLAPDNLLGLKTLIEKIVKEFEKDFFGFSIKIETSIPLERGMGSSAAVAVATTRALYDYFDIDLDDESLLAWANLSEKIVHGNPSGIDTAIVVGEKSLDFKKGEKFKAFEIDLKAFLIVADTGERGKTREAVDLVRERVKDEFMMQKIYELGKLSVQGRNFIENKNKQGLGKVMLRAHKTLKELGVSNNKLDDLVDRAMEENALGAKLTGGGKGGCMIALADNLEDAKIISKALIDEGANETWIASLEVDKFE